MKDEARPANAMAELRPETRKFLATLEPSDLDALERIIPLIKRLLAFGAVSKWLILTAVVIVIGTSSLWDSISNILKHLRTP